MTLLARVLRLPQSSPPGDEIHELTAQFYVTLEAYFAKVKSVGSPRCQDSYDRVERLLTDQPRTWSNAYAIEQLLIHLFDEDTVIGELQVRVREAKDALRPALAEYYGAEAAKHLFLLRSGAPS